jgi:signal transduction histidine kinase
MLSLELRSAFLYSGLIAEVFAFAILLLWRRNRLGYLAVWAAGFFVLGLGELLIAGRGSIPDLGSIVVANSGIVLADILVYAGTARYFGRRPAFWFSGVVLALSTLLFAYFTYVVPDIGARTLLATLAQLIFLALHLAQFFGPGWRAQLPASGLAVFFATALCVALMGRSVWVLIDPTAATIAALGNSQNAAVLIQSLAVAGLGLGLWNMHAVRLIEAASESEKRVAEAHDALMRLTVQLELRNTEYAEARDLAQAASRSKSQFLAHMSHELRTPLNAIIGFSEIIHDELLGPIGTPTYQEYAGDINRSGQHLLQLVTDILDMSRAEGGHLTLNEEVCDPRRVVDGAVSMLRQPALHGRLTLAIEAAADVPWLFADERRLRQIVINLVSNAVKFTLPGGRVTVILQHGPEASLDLTVEDTGIGMDEAHIQMALTPFGQVDSRLNRKYDGAGLGLPLTRQLIELHEGSLEIDSALDRGTRVTARFPAARLRPALV